MRTQSIYIVEDKIITAKSLAKNIKNFGYQIAGIATSGSEALAQIGKINPDLVLMDILLKKGDIDGITTAERIQSQVNVPIIYLTAHSDRETLHRAKVTSPFGYILKPYSEKALQISIEFALHKHQQEIQLIQREELLSKILNSTPEIATHKKQQIAAIAANEELNELSAYLLDVVLHELRSPLTVILSTSESLQNYRQKWTKEKQNKSLNRIQQAIRQITRLLDDITVWEELGTEQITLQPNWVNVITLSEEILNNLRLLDHENHQLIIDYQGEEKIFYLDQEILQRILHNLLLNGIKYSPQGSIVTLSINCTKNKLVLQIKDQGRGIPQAEQERIFEAFYRGSNTEEIKGAGLGLAIVRKYVQLCGGEISLESSSGSGTIFTVILPSSNGSQ